MVFRKYGLPQLAVMVFCIPNLLFSQTTLDQATLQKKLAEMSPSARSRLLGLTRDTSKANDSLQNRTLSDSLVRIEINKDRVRRDTSIYEKILYGETVNPDSIINTISVFGYEMFKNKNMGFASSMTSNGVTADYPVNIGDEIIINMWGLINEENRRLTVDRSGSINVPHIGPVHVLGMPFKTLQQNLIQRIQTINGVRASVNMGSLSDIRVYIAGEVDAPGSYTLGALSNVTNAIFAANGFKKQASMRLVQLKRNGKLIKTFDFYEFLLAGNNFSGDRLNNDDVIFVPIVQKMAAIVGNVRRSALYELQGTTTLTHLIELAGGLTPAAWTNRIQVERFTKNSYQVILDLDPESVQSSRFEIMDGDIVKIFPVVIRDKNTVYLRGNVARPGKYEFHEGMKISDCISSFDQLLPGTYLDYAVIKRTEPPSYSETIISFNLRTIVENPGSAGNLPLKPRDVVIVYNKYFFEPDKKVQISGAVNKPDAYHLIDNMCIKDIILEAGGLSENASIEKGELYRRVPDKDSMHTVKQQFCVSCAMEGDPVNNLVLKKSDHIIIRTKRGWEEKKSVALIGEFGYPGTYIAFETETLGELIQRAGGFKSNAYISAAIFTRSSVKELEKKRSLEYIQQLELDISTITTRSLQDNDPQLQMLLSQQKSLLNQLKSIEPSGRVVIDFTKYDNYKDIQIEDGDLLYIPKKHNTVSVLGEVFNPSTFVLEKGKNGVKHLLESSGGYKETANKKNVYVIKANGNIKTREMVNIDKYPLDAGDVVVVPYKMPSAVNKFKVVMETLTSVANFAVTSLSVTTSILILTRKE